MSRILNKGETSDDYKCELVGLEIQVRPSKATLKGYSV
jgi:hypothetical protein